VRYARAHEVPLDALKDRLEMCSRPSWGIALRRGLLPLSAVDLATIGAAMGVRSGRLFGVTAA
jgi:hypothetical protein